jgi:hypothetical protein
MENDPEAQDFFRATDRQIKILQKIILNELRTKLKKEKRIN